MGATFWVILCVFVRGIEWLYVVFKLYSRSFFCHAFKIQFQAVSFDLHKIFIEMFGPQKEVSTLSNATVRT